jgi:hypothetical protein
METDVSTAASVVTNEPNIDVVHVVVVKPDDTQAATTVVADTPTVGEVVEAIVDSVLGDNNDDTDIAQEFVIADPDASNLEVSPSDIVEPETAVFPSDTAVEEVVPVSEPEVDAEAAATEVHAAAATEAQERVEEAVAAGDYETAAQFRETAENEAWEAVDSSMLEGATSTELDSAAAYQEKAEEYEKEEAQHAAAGDYESAREAAAQAADATDWADFKAGGDDHTARAEAEYNKDDWAVWEQQQATEAAESAEAYAAVGELESAEVYAESAAEHQAEADAYGQEDSYADYSADLSVDTSASYEAPDTTSYDSGE